jgi:hypothetical protein
MSQVRIVSLLSILPLLLLGCGSQTSETSTPPVPPALPKVAESPNATEPLAGTKIAQGNAGLIPSTNAEVRSKAVSTGVRNDPFRGLNSTPDIKLSKEALAAQAELNAQKPPTPSFIPSVPSRPNPGTMSKSPRTSPGKPTSKPELPKAPPSTDLAKAVEITGVVQTGQSLMAIVRAPEEPTSRNVQAGDRLSNGQVLVKRISVGIAGNPTVVLEQNGVEVTKTLNNSTGLTS